MKKIRTFFSILVGKTILFLCELVGRGSAFPGKFVGKLNKNILSDFAFPDKRIVITGSAGKGTTSKIIANVCKNSNYKVTYNNKDSNEKSAIVTALIKDSKLNGKIKTDICVFELDERYVKYVFKDLKPTHVVITNITRDQPPRQRHFDFIFEEINKGLNEDMHLILNADDPYLQKFSIEKNYNITYYGIEKLKYDLKDNNFEVLNISRCPKCLGKLQYDYYHIEHIGKYKCSKCDLKRPTSKYKINKCDYNKNIIAINNNQINITNNMLYNLYNTLAAYSVLAEIGIDEKDISKEISKMNNNSKIYSHYTYKYRDIYVLNNKAENASTYNQSILFTNRGKELKTIILGWKEISRRYNFDDVSWLYDIDFESLDQKNIDKIICTGPQKYDIATRLKYAGINENKIKVYFDLYDAESEIKKSKGSIYAILNFDYLKPFKEIMEVKK